MKSAKILIDGVIFQVQRERPSGISRVWTEWLNILSRSEIAGQIILLDRDGSAPRIPGIRTERASRYDQAYYDADSIYLQSLVRKFQGDLFLSSYYTYPENSPCMIVLHDMTPEVLALDLSHPEWQAKARAIEQSFAYFTVSESTRRYFQYLYPHFNDRPIFTVPNAAGEQFHPHTEDEIRWFRQLYGLRKPYFMLSGHRKGYKNAILFFRALNLLKNRGDFEILCTGGAKEMETMFLPYLEGMRWQVEFLSEHDLPVAYSSAEALIYPSMHEGFGLPILEAMQCACPVITCPNSSLKEVGGDAALYVGEFMVEEMCRALEDVQEHALRKDLLDRGLINAERFSWEKTAEHLMAGLKQALGILPSVQPNPDLPLNTGMRLAHDLIINQSNPSLATTLMANIRMNNLHPRDFNFDEFERSELQIIHSANADFIKSLENVNTPECKDEMIPYWHALILESAGEEKRALKYFQAANTNGLRTARVVYLTARLAMKLELYITAREYVTALLKARDSFSSQALEEEITCWMNRIDMEQSRITESMEVKELDAQTLPEVLPQPYIPARESEDPPLLSFILPTRDRPWGLQQALESLRVAAFGIPYEVLVYLGGVLTDEIQSILSTYGVDQVILDKDIFRSGEEFSWSRVMNHGFNQASGDWIIYASDDVEYLPFSFNYALAVAEDNPHSGGITFLHRNTVEDYGGTFKDYGYDAIGEMAFINFGMIRRSAFLATQGFDEQFRFYWGDVDLCMQLWAAKYTIAASPFSLVDHNNIVDKFRTENSGDRYLLDTRRFLKKWESTQLFHNSRVLAKLRFVLPVQDAERTKVNLQRIREAGHDQKPVEPIPAAHNIQLPATLQLEWRDKDEDTPLISVLVSTYNSSRFLRSCLEDLEDQTISDRIEIIVVNSGSEENEGLIVEQYQQIYDNIRYIHTQERETVYSAWNRGIQVARGKYLTNANTDDRHHPEAFYRLVHVLESNPGIDVVYADIAVTSQANTTLRDSQVTSRYRWPEFDRKRLFRSCFIGPQPMWRRDLHDRFGLFDPDFGSAGDYEFWLRLSDRANFKHIPEILGLYYESSTSIEHRDHHLTIQESELAQQRYWNYEDEQRPTIPEIFLEFYDRFPEEQSERNILLVSVIVPTYNRADKLRSALESIADQSYPNIEVIVVNDAGEDVSEVVNEFSENLAVQYINLSRNGGAGAARNAGLKAAKGDYIAFLDDDDRFHPTHILALLSELVSNPHAVGVYSDAVQITWHPGKSGPKQDRQIAYSQDFSSMGLHVRNFIPILCLIVRRSVVAKAGFFDEKLTALEDWEWILKIVKHGDLVHLPFVTAQYTVRLDSKTRNILPPEQIKLLYQDIYTRHAQSDPRVAEARRVFYKEITGSDLAQDAPHLFFSTIPDGNQNNKNREKEQFVKQKIYLAENALKQGSLNKALRIIRGALQKYPSDTSLLMGHAQLLAGNNQHDRAVPLLEQTLEIDPNNWSARLRLIDEYLALENRVRAEDHIHIMDRVFPDHPDIRKRKQQILVFKSKARIDSSTKFSAEQLLDDLLNSPDLPTTLEQLRDELDQDLLDLIRQYIDTAVEQGNDEVASAMGNLAVHIESIITARNDPLVEASPEQMLDFILNAEDTEKALKLAEPHFSEAFLTHLDALSASTGQLDTQAGPVFRELSIYVRDVLASKDAPDDLARAEAFLEEILNAPDILPVLEENQHQLTSAFLQVITDNIREAENKGLDEAASALKNLQTYVEMKLNSTRQD